MFDFSLRYIRPVQMLLCCCFCYYWVRSMLLHWGCVIVRQIMQLHSIHVRAISVYFFFRFTLKFQKIENENAKYYLILIWQISEYDKELHSEASFIIEVVNGHWWNINGSNLFEFILSIVFIQIKNRDYWTEIPHTHTHIQTRSRHARCTECTYL